MKVHGPSGSELETTCELLLFNINRTSFVSSVRLPSLISTPFLKMKQHVVPLFVSLTWQHTLAVPLT